MQSVKFIYFPSICVSIHIWNDEKVNFFFGICSSPYHFLRIFSFHVTATTINFDFQVNDMLCESAIMYALNLLVSRLSVQVSIICFTLKTPRRVFPDPWGPQRNKSLNCLTGNILNNADDEADFGSDLVCKSVSVVESVEFLLGSLPSFDWFKSHTFCWVNMF